MPQPRCSPRGPFWGRQLQNLRSSVLLLSECGETACYTSFSNSERGGSPMRRQIALVFAVALILVAGSAAAEIFTVTLHNGNTFETRYQPQEASWDPSWVLLMAENGNQI